MKSFGEPILKVIQFLRHYGNALTVLMVLVFLGGSLKIALDAHSWQAAVYDSHAASWRYVTVQAPVDDVLEFTGTGLKPPRSSGILGRVLISGYVGLNGQYGIYGVCPDSNVHVGRDTDAGLSFFVARKQSVEPTSMTLAVPKSSDSLARAIFHQKQCIGVVEKGDHFEWNGRVIAFIDRP